MASGTVTRRGDAWRARYRHPDTGRQVQRTFDKQRPAQQWLRKQLDSIDEGRWIDPTAGKLTFGEYFARWAARQVWTSGTQAAMSLATRSTPFEHVQIRRISPTDVEAWVKSMTVTTTTRKELAPGTIKTRFVNVRSVFRAAVRDRIIATDPTEGIRLPRQRKREAAMMIPSPAQVRSVLDAADERVVALLAVCAFAGLRLGEAAALQVGDVDFLGRQLTVARQVQRAGKGQVEIRLPKYNSERVIPISDDLVTILAQHVELGLRGDWLFAGASDDPPHQNTVGHWWRRTAGRAGVQGFTLHSMRHFYASGLIAAGCDVVTVQRALGHASATTTLSTYSWLWPTAEDRTRKASATIAAQVLAPDVGKVWAKPAT